MGIQKPNFKSEGLQLEIDGSEVWFRLIGSFNAYNLLAAFSVARELDCDRDEVLLALSNLAGVNGRFQTIKPDGLGITAIVDYAHTPDALENVLKTIKDISGDGGEIITVAGCGGNRDRTKRPLMAEIAVRYSDQVVLTSDNPRDEDPAEILKEMEAGIPVSKKRKAMTIENRKEAIGVACRLANQSDVILVAGKGHETDQEIKGVKHPFDDREVLKENFEKLRS